MAEGEEHCDIFRDLQQFGYAVGRGWIPIPMLEELRLLCTQTCEQFQARRRDAVYGIRQLLTASPRLREIASSRPLIGIAREVVGPTARPVKGIFFDKTPDANWPVPWHQDVTITVQEPRDVPGYEMRPVKDGVVHAIPPVMISENLVAFRIHLDSATADHGALRVIPGSHLSGRLTGKEVTIRVANTAEVVVTAEAGDVMLMRPLLLHASSPCARPGHRRVIHIEYSTDDLPGGLSWAG